MHTQKPSDEGFYFKKKKMNTLRWGGPIYVTTRLIDLYMGVRRQSSYFQSNSTSFYIVEHVQSYDCSFWKEASLNIKWGSLVHVQSANLLMNECKSGSLCYLISLIVEVTVFVLSLQMRGIF